ncbi:MAG: hypothetical protein WBQ20_00520, partial [Methyloceanibacter sp.]
MRENFVSMNAIALKALAALVPACLLLVGSAVVFSKVRTVPTFLQLIGAGCLTVVVAKRTCLR